MRQHRQREGEGLAAAGLRDAQKIPALEQRGNGIDLDWGGVVNLCAVSACNRLSGRPRPAKFRLVTRDECSSTSHAGACCPCPSAIQWGRTVDDEKLLEDGQTKRAELWQPASITRSWNDERYIVVRRGECKEIRSVPFTLRSECGKRVGHADGMVAMLQVEIVVPPVERFQAVAIGPQADAASKMPEAFICDRGRTEQLVKSSMIAACLTIGLAALGGCNNAANCSGGEYRGGCVPGADGPATTSPAVASP
jgi:hypothetical protein